MNSYRTFRVALIATAATAQQYTYGNACGSLTDQDCAQVSGCTSCNWSWPSDDPDQWSSSEAGCRCMESSGESNNSGDSSSSADYTYGSACANLTDGQCGDNCNSCLFSWPSNDPQQWNSADADCRCETGGSNPDPSPSTDYTYGSACANLTDGDCGTNCNSCAWSWPTNDPQQWSSADAACRCESGGSDGGSDSNPSPSTDYTYGDACANLTDGECGTNCNSCSWSWPINDPEQWSSADAACRCESGGSDNSGGDGDSNDDSNNDGGNTPDPNDPVYQYQWGDACDTNTADDCAQVSGCTACKWSWPTDDPEQWSSNDAKCRCQTEEFVPTPIDRDSLEFGDDCATLTDGACGDGDSCQKCSWSWPKYDPLSFESLDAMCRCEYYEGETIPVFSYPELLVDVDGVQTPLWVQFDRSWSSAETDGTELGYDYNNRMYLSTQQEFDNTKYFMPNMLGGSVEYDIDLSEVGCGCVAALYTVLMPSVEDNEDPFKYCDANQVGGHWCPEFDLMEANKYSFHTTAHKCDAPTDGVYDNCDRGGECTLNIHENNIAGEYIPGSASGIDTNYEFHVKLDFEERDGVFVGYTVTMTQGDREFVQTTGDCEYLSYMTQDITSMAWVMSQWSSDGGIDWLQHGQCTGTCDRIDTYTSFKNLKFWTAASATPATVYKYGDECGSEQDQTTCGEECHQCHQSWPVDDPLAWNSEDAACRCLPMQRASHGYEYGEPCSTLSSGACGDDCSECNMSWPADDLLQMNSAESMCRCKPEPEVQEVTYGASCPNSYDGLCGADCHDCRETWPTDDEQKWYSEDMICRCKAEDIKETVFAEACNSLDAGLCGTHCRECHMSWEATDPASTRDCRCKRSW